MRMLKKGRNLRNGTFTLRLGVVWTAIMTFTSSLVDIIIFHRNQNKSSKNTVTISTLLLKLWTEILDRF